MDGDGGPRKLTLNEEKRKRKRWKFACLLYFSYLYFYLFIFIYYDDEFVKKNGKFEGQPELVCSTSNINHLANNLRTFFYILFNIFGKIAKTQFSLRSEVRGVQNKALIYIWSENSFPEQTHRMN